MDIRKRIGDDAADMLWMVARSLGGRLANTGGSQEQDLYYIYEWIKDGFNIDPTTPSSRQLIISKMCPVCTRDLDDNGWCIHCNWKW